MGTPIKIAIVGDEKDLSRSLDKAEASMGSAAKAADRAGDKIDRSFSTAANAADEMGSKSSQAAGGLGDLGGALAMMPGPLGAMGTGMEAAAPAIMGVTGAADLMNLAMNSTIVTTTKAKVATIGKTIADKASAVAAKATAAAQWALNAAMSANPIGLVVVAIAALVAGLVLAYKKSDTVRAIVDRVWASLKTAGKWFLDLAVKVGGFLVKWSPLGVAIRVVRDNFGQVVGKVGDVVGAIGGLPGKILGKAQSFLNAGKTLMGKIFEGFRAVGSIGADIGRNLFNGIRNGINAAIRGVNNFLPDKISIKGLPDINLPDNPIPQIPALASGGIVTGPTLALVGEAGPEAVIPLNGRYGFGNTYRIEVAAPVGSSPVDIGRELVRYITAYEQEGGRRRA